MLNSEIETFAVDSCTYRLIIMARSVRVMQLLPPSDKISMILLETRRCAVR